MNYLYQFTIRVRISSNCIELIFGKGHLSTLGASRDAVFHSSFCQTFQPWGSSSVTDVGLQGVFLSIKKTVSRRSQNRKMTLSKGNYNHIL